MQDQEVYIQALMSDPLQRTHVLQGRYAVKTGKGIVVKKRRNGKYDRVLSPGVSNIPEWLPATEVRDEQGQQQLMVNFVSHVEKGSDVNLASQLIIDVLTRKIDAAIIISNDGDLRYAVQFARQKVMVGIVNPGVRPTADALKSLSSVGKGGHWWRRLDADTLRTHQFPETVGGVSKPSKW